MTARQAAARPPAETSHRLLFGAAKARGQQIEAERREKERLGNVAERNPPGDPGS